ncbi:MAG: 2-C-methyl-D-erythritol 2,4-cyclodiphosphate synthase [Clostridia bacterium]|nr:2-C-methyl-D-erythritol 2,4-cyclodiphosphate synthase [Clostridia bacterium]
MVRVGIGYDVHRLTQNRKLILGGVEIPFELGLLGYSDADVLVHAIMDAMLGACALGDIGLHFPDTDERYNGVSSIELLKEVNGLIKVKGYCVNNIDAVLVAQKPKIQPFIYEMRKNIAEALGIDASLVSVKATTTEGLGFEGSMEGISAQSIVSLENR